MAKILGVGGVFFKANDSVKLAEWYRNTLGIEIGEYGAVFKPESVPEAGYTAFGIFKGETQYFDVPNKDSQQPYMINFMVDDLFAMLIKIEKNGGTLVGKPEEYDYGKFGWFADPEGNKIELWQPL